MKAKIITISKIVLFLIAGFAACVALGTVGQLNDFTLTRTAIQELICFAIIGLCYLISTAVKNYEQN